MIAVVQRVSEASVRVEGEIIGQINQGFMVLLGIALDDTEEDVAWIVKKICGLRIFSDENDKLNLDIAQVSGNILLISQFTLQASTKKGNRPSFIEAAKPDLAIPLYQKTISSMCETIGKKIEKGTFGADMKVSLINDGPLTIVLDSKCKR
ncbi:MAG: D-tyrosyl-tRNA(Tyr) deacylase [Arcticibacterium sp.]|jgi:D-tyrosyl-tRNA(Tyr) deacylase